MLFLFVRKSSRFHRPSAAVPRPDLLRRESAYHAGHRPNVLHGPGALEKAAVRRQEGDHHHHRYGNDKITLHRAQYPSANPVQTPRPAAPISVPAIHPIIEPAMMQAMKNGKEADDVTHGRTQSPPEASPPGARRTSWLSDTRLRTPASPTTCLTRPFHKPKSVSTPTTTRTIISNMLVYLSHSARLFTKVYNG